MGESWEVEKVRIEGKIEIVEVRIEAIDQRLKQIEATLHKLVWLVISGIGAAFVAWLINGGLVLP